MVTTPTISEIHALLDADEYVEAKSKIDTMRSLGVEDSILLLFEALCAYESDNDIETLRLIAEFLSSSDSDHKKPYARFTAAICLVNLGLYEQARELLGTVPESYPDLKETLFNVINECNRQKQAIIHYSKILKNA